jgi:hypothetical protein
MSWPLIISLICAGFALGAALRLLRSPNLDPFADLARDGKTLTALITGIEATDGWFNVIVAYDVLGTAFSRTLPWPSGKPNPVIGAAIEIRYLPSTPGLSRVV